MHGRAYHLAGAGALRADAYNARNSPEREEDAAEGDQQRIGILVDHLPVHARVVREVLVMVPNAAVAVTKWSGRLAPIVGGDQPKHYA